MSENRRLVNCFQSFVKQYFLNEQQPREKVIYEWNYFNSLIEKEPIDIERIESYLEFSNKGTNYSSFQSNLNNNNDLKQETEKHQVYDLGTKNECTPLNNNHNTSINKENFTSFYENKTSSASEKPTQQFTYSRNYSQATIKEKSLDNINTNNIHLLKVPSASNKLNTQSSTKNSSQIGTTSSSLSKNNNNDYSNSNYHHQQISNQYYIKTQTSQGTFYNKEDDNLNNQEQLKKAKSYQHNYSSGGFDANSFTAGNDISNNQSICGKKVDRKLIRDNSAQMINFLEGKTNVLYQIGQQLRRNVSLDTHTPKQNQQIYQQKLPTYQQQYSYNAKNQTEYNFVQQKRETNSFPLVLSGKKQSNESNYNKNDKENYINTCQPSLKPDLLSNKTPTYNDSASKINNFKHNSAQKQFVSQNHQFNYRPSFQQPSTSTLNSEPQPNLPHTSENMAGIPAIFKRTRTESLQPSKPLMVNNNSLNTYNNNINENNNQNKNSGFKLQQPNMTKPASSGNVSLNEINFNSSANQPLVKAYNQPLNQIEGQMDYTQQNYQQQQQSCV